MLASRVSWAIVLTALAACGEKGDAPEAHVCTRPEGAALNAPAVIESGSFMSGDSRFYAEEGPRRRESVASFSIDATEVTNAEFRAFVEATGYETLAERGLDPATYPDMPREMLKPGSAVFVPPAPGEETAEGGWWRFVEGANWRRPTGPGSDIEGMDDYPVVHIAYDDALAYATWKGRRLPTEIEWEYAARGGLDGAVYVWGDEPPEQSDPRANIWEGVFPYTNSARDGYAGLAPVGCYPPNGYGLYDMAGNVWEMTSTPFTLSREAPAVAGMEMGMTGAGGGDAGETVIAIKGGSFLCAPNYCLRYRPAARQPHDVTLGASHVGFRTAGDP